MVTTERYYTHRRAEGPWDDIVVGSGMGGMTTAALLSRLGRRVLVLEQHYVPGGFTHTFRRKKWVWDVGVHAVGQVTPRFVVGRLLHTLSEGQLEWASLGPTYDEFSFPDGYRIAFPDHRDTFRQNLVRAFPSDAAAIDAYLAEVRETSGMAKAFFATQALSPKLSRLASPLLRHRVSRALRHTTEQVVTGLTDNERLRTVLTAQWGYYGSPPARSAFMAHALTVKHFWYGAYYPVGGSTAIAEAILKPVVRRGGAVRVHAPVAEIVLDGARAVGVRLESGEELYARRVFSAVGAPNTVQRLLPELTRQAPWAQRIARLAPAPAHVCLYLAFRGDIRAAGAGSANQWFYETWSRERTTWDYRDDDAEAPILYCSFPSLKDPTHDPVTNPYHTGEVVTFVPWDEFASHADSQWQKRNAGYDALKERLTQRLLRQFLRHMPRLEPFIERVELSTPASTAHFTRAAMGSIYGLEPTAERFLCRDLRPNLPIEGLYQSGVDVGMCGVVGAMVGGALAALAAEPLGTLQIMRRAK